MGEFGPINPEVATLGDALTNPTTILVGSHLLTWDGTDWSRLRIPDAAALGDALANPTVIALGAYALVWDGTNWHRLRLPAAAALADGAANPTTHLMAQLGHLFNGTTWDRERGTVQATLLASASRTTIQTGADTVNYNHRGIQVTVDVTVAGTGSITVSIERKDPTSGKYTAILTSIALTVNATTILTVYPGLTAVANVTASDVLPRDWRIVVTANNANAITYSVGYHLML